MDFDLISLVPSSLSANGNNAIYSCTLTNLWSEATHPVLYDSIRATAHWSPPILAAHGESFSLWVPNTVASPSIEMVAEMGVTSPLRQEIVEAQGLGLAGDFSIGTDQFNAFDEPQIFDDLELTPELPFVSTISMIAPSPDWISGISSFRPVDAVDGVWYEFFEVATYPWDAGTEMGDTYSLSNAAQVPPNPITRLTVDTVPENGIFLNPSGTAVLPVALWSCTLRQDEPETISTDPIIPPDIVVEDLPQQEEISVLLEEDQNTTDIIDDDEEEEEIGSNDITEEESPVCVRYFKQCAENSDCCSNNCSRGRCGERSRASGRNESLRLSNQGGVVLGGAAGRRRRRDGIVRRLIREEGRRTEVEQEPRLRGSADRNGLPDPAEFFAPV